MWKSWRKKVKCEKAECLSEEKKETKQETGSESKKEAKWDSQRKTDSGRLSTIIQTAFTGVSIMYLLKILHLMPQSLKQYSYAVLWTYLAAWWRKIKIVFNNSYAVSQNHSSWQSDLLSLQLKYWPIWPIACWTVIILCVSNKTWADIGMSEKAAITCRCMRTEHVGVLCVICICTLKVVYFKKQELPLQWPHGPID